MAEPSLQQVFGANAVQDANTLTITKADLTGLSAAANNRAEQLFVALLLKAKESLTPTNQETNADQSVTIEEPAFGADSLVQRNDQQYRQKSYSINLQKLDPNASIDPDDY